LWDDPDADLDERGFKKIPHPDPNCRGHSSTRSVQAKRFLYRAFKSVKDMG